jgi:Family of unknown function (DUF6055)
MITSSNLISRFVIVLFTVFSAMYINEANAKSDPISNDPIVKKELYLPAKIGHVPENNDFKNNESEYSFQRMVEGDNIAILWHKEYGDDPMANPDEKKRFDVKKALVQCERVIDYYINVLKMVRKGNSVSDQYKIVVIVFGGNDNTAYGGGEGNVGMLWTPATRINKEPYGVLAHELGHTFQYLSRADNGSWPRGSISEMSAQYMLWQVYPEWMTFENYHLVDFMKQTHYAFLHPKNMYHSPYVLEYWSEKYGKEFFGNLSRETMDGEDPVMTYKRMNSLTQEQFNDEMFDASRKFITWDMKRIEGVAKQYANQHRSALNDIGNGWYRIAESDCPQNYGYNGIKLKVPKAGTNVVLDFKGIAGAEGFSNIQSDKAGWRYGFIASLKDGRRVYGKVYKDPMGTATFKVPENTEYLWLVVSGAPTEHWPVIMKRGSSPDTKEEQWPYEVKLSGTTFDDAMIKGKG